MICIDALSELDAFWGKATWTTSHWYAAQPPVLSAPPGWTERTVWRSWKVPWWWTEVRLLGRSWKRVEEWLYKILQMIQHCHQGMLPHQTTLDKIKVSFPSSKKTSSLLLWRASLVPMAVVSTLSGSRWNHPDLTWIHLKTSRKATKMCHRQTVDIPHLKLYCILNITAVACCKSYRSTPSTPHSFVMFHPCNKQDFEPSHAHHSVPTQRHRSTRQTVDFPSARRSIFSETRIIRDWLDFALLFHWLIPVGIAPLIEQKLLSNIRSTAHHRSSL